MAFIIQSSFRTQAPMDVVRLALQALNSVKNKMTGATRAHSMSSFGDFSKIGFGVYSKIKRKSHTINSI